MSAAGDYGKPRPAVVIQSNWLKATDGVLVALLTSVLIEAPLYRLQIEPSNANGLKASSQVMVDKIIAMPRLKCGQIIGSIDEPALIALNHMLLLVIGLADRGAEPRVACEPCPRIEARVRGRPPTRRGPPLESMSPENASGKVKSAL